MVAIFSEFTSNVFKPCSSVYFQGDVEEDEAIPDRESDIKPRFHKSKTHSVGTKHDTAEDVGISSVHTFLISSRHHRR